MFKEILQIIPKLSGSDLSNMERSLSSRFSRVASKFGKGLVGALSGGGVVGAALGLIDKFLSPLQATQDAIDRQLSKADAISASAEQFNTTAGKLFKLQQMAAGKGLDASALDVMMIKFQGAVAAAKADPTKPSAVRQFANDKDIADSFFQFIQDLGKIQDKNKQVLIQTEVFGEKQIGKMSQFLNTKDWFDLQKKTVGSGVSAGALTGSIEKQGALNNMKDEMTALRGTRDMLSKGDLITADMVKADARKKDLEQSRENRDIANYSNLMRLSNAVDMTLDQLKILATTLATTTVNFYNIDKNIEKISKSSIWNGILKIIKADW